MLKSTPRFTALLLLSAAILSSCGGGDGGGAGTDKPRAREGACKDEISVKATFLPKGFDPTLEKGPGGGKPEVKDAVVYHWAGSKTTQYIDVFRGSQRNKLKGTKVRMLGVTGRIGKLPGGYGAKAKLGRGTCTKYQLEAYGVSSGDFKKVVAGLERTPSAAAEKE